MEGEGPDEGPLDEPGGPALPYDPLRDQPGVLFNYRLQRLNQVMRRGGRGCLPSVLVVALLIRWTVVLAGR